MWFNLARLVGFSAFVPFFVNLAVLNASERSEENDTFITQSRPRWL